MDNAVESLWAGVDWGGSVHSVCVTCAGGKVYRRWRAGADAEGVAALVKELLALPGLQGVAIETNRHLIVDALWKAGITVYPVNPKLAHRWRGCLSVNEVKDDARDAWTLAHGLSLHQSQLRPLAPEEPAMRVLSLLCESEQHLIAKRTAAVCELQAVLHQYFPAVLAWFNDWALPGPWSFVADFPTPQALAAASKQTLCGWFKARRMRLMPSRLEQIEQRQNVLALAADGPVAQAFALRAIALAAELQALEKGIRGHREAIEEQYGKQEQAPLISSLPGAGPKLAPRLLCIFANCQQRYDSADGICQYTGTAPVTMQSGNTKHVRFRRACKKNHRNAMHQFAFVSLRFSAWANAYYKKCRDEKQHHAKALRNLAIKWTKIIYRMCCQGEHYDEERYLAALKKNNSPLLKYLDEDTCGKTGGKLKPEA